MVVEYIRYKISTDRTEAFIAAYGRAAKALENSAHCKTYELSHCADDKELFMLRIEWDSVDGHMNGFQKSQEFQGFLVEVRPYYGNILEMKHYELTPVRSAA